MPAPLVRVPPVPFKLCSVPPGNPKKPSSELAATGLEFRAAICVPDGVRSHVTSLNATTDLGPTAVTSPVLTHPLNPASNPWFTRLIGPAETGLATANAINSRNTNLFIRSTSAATLTAVWAKPARCILQS